MRFQDKVARTLMQGFINCDARLRTLRFGHIWTYWDVSVYNYLFIIDNDNDRDE